MLEQDLPSNTIQILLATEQKKREKEIKSEYRLVSVNEKLSIKWNKAIDMVFSDFLSNILTDYTERTLISSTMMSAMRDPEVDIDFTIESTYKLLEMPLVFRRQGKNIIAEGDPMFNFCPWFLKKMVMSNIKQTVQVSDIIVELYMRAAIEKFKPYFRPISNSYYRIAYYNLVAGLASDKVIKFYLSGHKKVFVIKDPSFKGAASDYVGNLLLSELLVNNSKKDDSLEIIMVHEALHLLLDFKNKIMSSIFRRIAVERIIDEFINLSSELSGNEISQEDLDKAQSSVQLLMRTFRDFLSSFDVEAMVDGFTLTYFRNQPDKRKKYSEIIASYEMVPSERIFLINAYNECDQESPEALQEELQSLLNQGELQILLNNTKLNAHSSSQCSVKLINAFQEYMVQEFNRALVRLTTKNAEMFFQKIYNSLKNGESINEAKSN